MRSGNSRIFDRSRTPFAHCLERGTTIIRCSPQRYYDEVEKRKQLLPLPACGHRVVSSKKLTKTVRATRASLQKRPTVPPSAAALPDAPADRTDDCNSPLPLGNEDDLTEQCRTPSFQGSGLSDFGDKAELVEEAEGAPSRAEEDVSPRVKVDWDAANNRKLDRREDELHGAEAIVRGYVDLAHALLLHFEETLIAKQRLTQGSLQCAEILCRALRQIQDVNPRLAYLVDRISIAVALLHKRKLADEKAAERGSCFKETESFPLCRNRSLNAQSMSTYQQQVFEQHQHQRALGGVTKNARGESADHVKMLPTYVAVERQRSRSVSPAVQQFASCKCVTPVASNAASRESSGPAYCSRGSPRLPSDSNDEVGDATAVPSRKDTSRVFCAETAPLVFRAEGKAENHEAFTQPPVRRHADRARGSCPPAKHTSSRASSVTLDPLEAPGGLTSFLVGPEGPLKTHFVASQATGEKASACQPSRVGVNRRLFGEHEGEQAVRPLILSETLDLSDKFKNTSARENDSYDAAVREALWLIKCASDLIQSGEGPEYVEKQLFRYCRSRDVDIAAHKPVIPEGMQASQGKYVLLRYTIAVVEAEYGDSSRAADPHLYLPDLLRMRDILLRKEEGQRLEIRERRIARSSEASHALRSELMSRRSFESSGKAGSRSPSVEDAPAHSPFSSSLQRAGTLDPSPSQSVEIAARSSPLGGRSGSGLVEHSLSLRRAEENNLLGTSWSSPTASPSTSVEKPSPGERQGSKMSLAEQMTSAAANQMPALSPPVDGLKLSVSSLRRDSATGTFSSRVFEAPSSPTEPPAISLSTSEGLRNVSASRSPRTSLPDIPDFVLGSEGSQQTEA
ncbi:hypothetical protein Emag_002137 [Eimeria magna]